MRWRVDSDLFKNKRLRWGQNTLCILLSRMYLLRCVGYGQQKAQ